MEEDSVEKMRAAMSRLDNVMDAEAFRQSVLDPRFAHLLLCQTESMCLTRLVENIDSIVRDFGDILPKDQVDAWHRRKEAYLELMAGFLTASKILADLQAANIGELRDVSFGDVLSSDVIDLPDAD